MLKERRGFQRYPCDDELFSPRTAQLATRLRFTTLLHDADPQARRSEIRTKNECFIASSLILSLYTSGPGTTCFISLFFF